MSTVNGVHHVTAITGDAQRNFEFYTRVLGLRFVKRTVNQDDPGTYHLYYGNETGEPGTALTFFVWPHLPIKQSGVGTISSVLFSVPKDSLSYWKNRLEKYAVEYREEQYFEHAALVFADPDGMTATLVACTEESDHGWSDSPVPEGSQTRRMEGVELTLAHLSDKSAEVLEFLGYTERQDRAEGGGYRLGHRSGQGWIDLTFQEGEKGELGLGAIHHTAFRVKDGKEQEEVREELARRGFEPTPVIDRFYFKSVYFLLPERVLFEIATDGPGFCVDEEKDHLGEGLVLPPQFEKYRERIEAGLPPLDTTYGE